ncbi:MAG: thioredoxin fold domain-containing protein [bacterium]|nr:thioredoxin fold domain-containing protein [bacterium]
MIRKITFIIVLMMYAFNFASASEVTLDFKTDWAKELKDAAANGKPVFMDFYTDWCPPCKLLNSTTFKDQAMAGYFKKENYVLIKVNPEKDRVAESKFNVYSYPTLVVFDKKGKEIDRILGYRTAEEMIKLLSDLQKGIGTIEDYLNRYRKTKGKATEENFEIISTLTNKYIAKAEYPQALELVDEVVKLDKDNGHKKAAGALFQKGYIYYKWKKFHKAIDELLAIHKVFPKSGEAVDAFNLAATCSYKLKDKALNLKIWKIYVKAYPKGKNIENTKELIAQLEVEMKEQGKQKGKDTKK